MPTFNEKPLQLATLWKETIVAANGVGSDINPVLVLQRDGVDLAFLGLPGDPSTRNAAITTAITTSNADQVVIVHEGYTWDGADYVDGYLNDPRSLVQRFADGDPHVFETLNVLWATATEGRLAALPYRYVGRTVQWQPDKVTSRPTDEVTVGGSVVEAVHDGFVQQAKRSEPALGMEQLARATGLQVIAPMLPRPDRNAPCPCGSGRKSKTCCWR